MEYRVLAVPGIENGGMLHLRGPNLMLGYLRPDGSIEPVRSACGDGWYDTGDVVSVDDGYRDHPRPHAALRQGGGGNGVAGTGGEDRRGRLA